jgi:hypothetical protein
MLISVGFTQLSWHKSMSMVEPFGKTEGTPGCYFSNQIYSAIKFFEILAIAFPSALNPSGRAVLASGASH